MTRRALVVVLCFLSCCFSLAAQQTSRLGQTKYGTATLEQLSRSSALNAAATLTLYRPENFSAMRGSLLDADLPLLILLDPRSLPVWSALGPMGMAPLDLFPDALVSADDEQQADATPVDGKDSPGEVVSPRVNPIYANGEIGFFYGRSSGKFAREVEQGYILGGVGNDKFYITVGATYGESSGDVPRLRSESSKH